MIENLSKERRRELMSSAVELYKSGAEPSPDAEPRGHYTRAEYRQAARAFGWRGKKAKRQNIVKRTAEVRRAVLVDEALHAAQHRAAHPIRSRLGRS